MKIAQLHISPSGMLWIIRVRFLRPGKRGILLERHGSRRQTGLNWRCSSMKDTSLVLNRGCVWCEASCFRIDWYKGSVTTHPFLLTTFVKRPVQGSLWKDIKFLLFLPSPKGPAQLAIAIWNLVMKSGLLIIKGDRESWKLRFIRTWNCICIGLDGSGKTTTVC